MDIRLFLVDDFRRTHYIRNLRGGVVQECVARQNEALVYQFYLPAEHCLLAVRTVVAAY